MRPLSDLRESGMLWLINRTVFHPRGLGLALHFEGDSVVGWSFVGSGSEPMAFVDDDDDDGFARANETLKHACAPPATADGRD